jgi:hypothetical protein
MCHAKALSLLLFPLQEVEIDPICCHETVIENIAFLLTIKVDLWWSEAAGAEGVRTGVEK